MDGLLLATFPGAAFSRVAAQTGQRVFRQAASGGGVCVEILISDDWNGWTLCVIASRSQIKFKWIRIIRIWRLESVDGGYFSRWCWAQIRRILLETLLMLVTWFLAVSGCARVFEYVHNGGWQKIRILDIPEYVGLQQFNIFRVTDLRVIRQQPFFKDVDHDHVDHHFYLIGILT